MTMTLLIALALSAVQDPPEKEMKVSLKQCVALALNNNPGLEVSRFFPWIQEETLLGSYGTFDTVLFATGTSSTFNVPASSGLQGAGSVRRSSQSYAGGVRRLFPNGLLAEFRVEASRTKDNFAFTSINPSWNDRAGIQLTLPVLRNGGEEFNTSTLYVNKLRRDIAVDDFETALTESTFGVLSAYYELVFAAEGERLATESLDLATQLVTDSQRRLDQGLVARVQVTEAQAQAAQEEQNLITSQQTHKSSMDSLARLIDPDMLSAESVLRLVTTDGPMPFDTPLDVVTAAKEGIQRTLAERADLRGGRRAIRVQELIAKQAENQTLPQLDLVLGAFYQGVSGTADDAYHSLSTGDFYDLSLTFSLEIPLENRGGEANLRAAELERRRLDAARRDAEVGAVVEVRDAVRSIKTQERSIEAAREQARLAQEQLDAEQARFRQGLTTTYFVNVARNGLTQAKLNALRARIDYTLARLNYSKVTGRLLRDWDINVNEELSPRR